MRSESVKNDLLLTHTHTNLRKQSNL